MNELQTAQTDRDERTAVKAMEALYESAFPSVAGFISKRNGSFEDARDIFQDAMVLFYEKKCDPDFRCNTSDEAYIIGIARHLWFRKFRMEHKNGAVAIKDDLIDPLAEGDVDGLRLLHLLSSAGRKCMDLLQAFYYRKGGMKQLSEQLGYRSERSATVQKYKCMEKVRDTVKKESLSYADFVN